MFRPELVAADADDDEATEDMSIYRKTDDDVSVLYHHRWEKFY